MSYFNKVQEFFQYDFYFYFSLIFLALIFILNFSKLSEEKKIKIYKFTFLLILIIYLSYSFYLTKLQYQIWKAHPLSKFLLPPYQDISYFLSYSLFHYFRDLYFRILGSLFVILLLFFINFTLKRDVFYDEEKILLPLLSLFFFFPYNFLFIILGFFMLLLIIMLKVLLNKKHISQYHSFKNYWLVLVLILYLLQPIFLTNYHFLKYKP